jgi:cystathionine gamma-lyase
VKFATKAIRVGQAPEKTTGAVVVPIYQTANFTFAGFGKPREFDYSRSGNPTRAALEECLAALEEARFGLAFGSGMAAEDTVLSILRPGDHVVSATHIYGGTHRLFESVYAPRGVTFSYVANEDPEAFARALTPRTKLIWAETPANPLLQLVDLRAVSAIARKAGAPLVVDNTFASPCFQRPLTLGADVVVHSTTKYVSGHSDVIGGAVLTNDQNLHTAFKFYQNAVGNVPGQFDAWLSLRGLKTLAVRMERHAANAAAIAAFLAAHPRVERVVYPGLASHPQHALARAQMDGFGAMLTFAIRGGTGAVRAFLEALQLFLFAESLGGVESLISHPVTMSHASMPAEERAARGITENLLRVSVGIEDKDDLIQDLSRALAASNV